MRQHNTHTKTTNQTHPPLPPATPRPPRRHPARRRTPPLHHPNHRRQPPPPARRPHRSLRPAQHPPVLRQNRHPRRPRRRQLPRRKQRTRQPQQRIRPQTRLARRDGVGNQCLPPRQPETPNRRVGNSLAHQNIANEQWWANKLPTLRIAFWNNAAAIGQSAKAANWFGANLSILRLNAYSSLHPAVCINPKCRLLSGSPKEGCPSFQFSKR